MVGLVVGKVVGITGATLLAVQRRVGTLAEDMSPRDVVGVASLAGIGFTVSLFIADLAYNPIPEIEAETAKIGILAASLLSVFAGIAIFAGRTSGHARAGEAGSTR